MIGIMIAALGMTMLAQNAEISDIGMELLQTVEGYCQASSGNEAALNLCRNEQIASVTELLVILQTTPEGTPIAKHLASCAKRTGAMRGGFVDMKTAVVCIKRELQAPD